MRRIGILFLTTREKYITMGKAKTNISSVIPSEGGRFGKIFCRPIVESRKKMEKKENDYGK